MNIRKSIIQEIADEDGGDIKQIESIVSFQSKFTKRVMESGSLEAVRWPRFGVFKVKEFRKKKLLEEQNAEPIQA